jgi:hypothetical protein
MPEAKNSCQHLQFAAGAQPKAAKRGALQGEDGVAKNPKEPAKIRPIRAVRRRSRELALNGASLASAGEASEAGRALPRKTIVTRGL